MRALVLGAGLVGRALAADLRRDGHHVVATTTTPAKVDDLHEEADEVHVLVGSDRDAVARAAAGCDAVVVTAGPSAARSMTPEQRAATYREVLVATADAVVTAVEADARVVALSSLSVYGDAADHLDRVDEDGPTTTSADPSPSSFLAMERTYLDGLGDRACVLRCADVYGAGDPPIEAKVAMAHDLLGGSVPFAARALLYRVAVADVVGAIRHALDHGLHGVFNLTHAEVPPTNGEVFDAISRDLGRPPLAYRGEIAAPAVPVDTSRLAATGFTAQHTAVASAAR